MQHKLSKLFILMSLTCLSAVTALASAPLYVSAEEPSVRSNGHTVCLDPGPQDSKTDADSGAMNLEIALSLQDTLQERGYSVIMAGTDTGTPAGQKKTAASSGAGDAEILVCLEAAEKTSSPKPEMTALCPPAQKSGTSALPNESFRLSFCILDACCAATGFTNLGVQESDTLTAAGSNSMPATILKTGFPDSGSAASLQANAELRDVMAGGIADGIDFYFGIYNTEEDTVDAKPAESTVSGTKTDAKLRKLEKQLQEQLPKDNGEWAVYIGDLSTGSSTTINDHRMQAASLVKLYIMGAAYEKYRQLTGTYGADNVDRLLTSMITQSDNEAANTLTEYLGKGDPEAGMQAVTDYCTRHGYTDSSMGRLLLHSNEFGDNYTSVKDCGAFLTGIYNNAEGKASDMPYAKEMYELLKQQTRTTKIPSLLPAGVHVANKTGELGDVENDAGIIYDTGKDNDLVVCFMSENVGSPGAAQSAIGELSLYVYDYYNG